MALDRAFSAAPREILKFGAALSRWREICALFLAKVQTIACLEVMEMDWP